MNLRGGQITVGEVLSNPQARALFQREFPGLINSPMIRMARGMSLNRAIAQARGHVSQAKINQLLTQLQAI